MVSRTVESRPKDTPRNRVQIDGAAALGTRQVRTGGPTATAPRGVRAARSVLRSTRRSAFGERPDAVLELHHEKAVVLTGRLQRAMPGIEAQLRSAPVGISGLCIRAGRCRWSLVEVLRTVARRGHSGRIEVCNLLWAPRIAYIEHPQARVEVGACERGCIMF